MHTLWMNSWCSQKNLQHPVAKKNSLEPLSYTLPLANASTTSHFTLSYFWKLLISSSCKWKTLLHKNSAGILATDAAISPLSIIQNRKIEHWQKRVSSTQTCLKYWALRYMEKHWFSAFGGLTKKISYLPLPLFTKKEINRKAEKMALKQIDRWPDKSGPQMRATSEEFSFITQTAKTVTGIHWRLFWNNLKAPVTGEKKK